AGTFTPMDGLADPNSVVMAYIGAARRLGARCLTGVAVEAIEIEQGRVTGVRTAEGRVATDCGVNAAGPGGRPLAAPAGVGRPVERAAGGAGRGGPARDARAAPVADHHAPARAGARLPLRHRLRPKSVLSPGGRGAADGHVQCRPASRLRPECRPGLGAGPPG